MPSENYERQRIGRGGMEERGKREEKGKGGKGEMSLRGRREENRKVCPRGSPVRRPWSLCKLPSVFSFPGFTVSSLTEKAFP